jgi:hypothetical protein
MQSHTNIQNQKYINKHTKNLWTTGKMCDYIRDLIEEGPRDKEETKKESKLL